VILVTLGALAEIALVLGNKTKKIQGYIVLAIIMSIISSVISWFDTSSWKNGQYDPAGPFLFSFFFLLPVLIIYEYKKDVLPPIHHGTLMLLNLALAYFILSTNAVWLWPLFLIVSGLWALNFIRPNAWPWWGPVLGYWGFLLTTLIIGGTFAWIQLFGNEEPVWWLAATNSVLLGMNVLYVSIVLVMLILLIPIPEKGQTIKQAIQDRHEDFVTMFEKYETDAENKTRLAIVLVLVVFAMGANAFLALVPPWTVMIGLVIGASLWPAPTRKKAGNPAVVEKKPFSLNYQ